MDDNDDSFKKQRKVALKHLQFFITTYQVPDYVAKEVGDIEYDHLTSTFVERFVCFFGNEARVNYTGENLLSGPTATGYLR